MKTTFFSTLMVIIISVNAYSQAADSLFVAGNDAYAKGNYKESLRLYEKVLDKGYMSEAVYFNLANSHYKLNNVAESIYFYEKAKKLDPSDPAIKNNLTYAEQMRVDEIEALPQPEVKEFTRETALALSLTSWSWIAIISGFLASGAFIVYFLRSKTAQKRLFFTLFVIFSLSGLASHLMASTQERIVKNTQYAIIFPEEIKVYAEPNPKSERLFMLHEGTKVSVESEFNEFSKIKLKDGSTGWTRSSYFKEL